MFKSLSNEAFLIHWNLCQHSSTGSSPSRITQLYKIDKFYACIGQINFALRSSTYLRPQTRENADSFSLEEFWLTEKQKPVRGLAFQLKSNVFF